jgi:hypothetical protein
MSSKLEIRNLFLTRTAIGVYVTTLYAIGSVATSLANKFDAHGKLTATDWVSGIASIVTIVTSQGVVMASRVGANGSLIYTPKAIWGPDKEDVVQQAIRISNKLPREETYVQPPLEEQLQAERPVLSDAEKSQGFDLQGFDDCP